MAGISVTVRASVTQDGKTFTGVITLPRYGALAAADKVNLAMQVAGQLAMGSVTGYGCLALLNKVSLNTDVVGALNGATQVTNLGTLVYAAGVSAIDRRLPARCRLWSMPETSTPPRSWLVRSRARNLSAGRSPARCSERRRAGSVRRWM